MRWDRDILNVSALSSADVLWQCMFEPMVAENWLLTDHLVGGFKHGELTFHLIYGMSSQPH